MEFKFRAVDNRPSNCFPMPSSSSSSNPRAGQALRSSGNFNQMLPQSLLRELEKQQIREEIMARRRLLEAEVRMELIAEREMAAMHRALYFQQTATMRPNDNYHRWQCKSLPPPPPLQPVFPPPMLPIQATEVLDTQVNVNPGGKKNKLIILDKPDPNRVVGAKWKTPPHAGVSKLPMPLINLEKKPTEEWSCAICQVSATSERGFMEHLQGKKHKIKEARLRDQRMEKNSTTTLLNKKLPSKHVKGAEKTVDHSDKKLDDGEKMEDRKDEFLIEKTKVYDGEKMENKKYKFLVKKTKRAKRLRNRLDTCKNLEPTVVDDVKRTPESTLQKKNMFWCEICDVRVYSEVVMETHKKGKKHIARLLKLAKKDKANELEWHDGPQMPKDTNVSGNETNEKVIDVPIISIINTVNENSPLDGIQMTKETDQIMANEANEKLTCSYTPIANAVNEQAILDGVQMAKDISLAKEANAEVIVVTETDHFN